MVSRKYLTIFSSITIVVILLDQLTKYLIKIFSPNWDIKILTIELIKNTGAGFGILQDQTFWLGIISILVAVIIIYHYKKIPKRKFPQIFFALFLGGVVGNLIDRLFVGFVIDFVNFSFWPAFNLADACITVSVVGLVIYFWNKK